jgi:hypothetical protein
MRPTEEGAMMDVDSLRAELETQLAKNPDPDAPDGFRDRFETLVEQYKDADDDVPKPQMEAMLQQVRAEAEAAWCCVEHARGEDAPPYVPEAPPRAEPAVKPTSPGDPVERVDAQIEPAEAGFVQRYGIGLVVAVIVLVGAYYFFRR